MANLKRVEKMVTALPGWWAVIDVNGTPKKAAVALFALVVDDNNQSGGIFFQPVIGGKRMIIPDEDLISCFHESEIDPAIDIRSLKKADL